MFVCSLLFLLSLALLKSRQKEITNFQNVQSMTVNRFLYSKSKFTLKWKASYRDVAWVVDQVRQHRGGLKTLVFQKSKAHNKRKVHFHKINITFQAKFYFWGFCTKLRNAEVLGNHHNHFVIEGLAKTHVAGWSDADNWKQSIFRNVHYENVVLLSAFPPKSGSLLAVLVYDLLFGAKKIKGGGAVKRQVSANLEAIFHKFWNQFWKTEFMKREASWKKWWDRKASLQPVYLPLE